MSCPRKPKPRRSSSARGKGKYQKLTWDEEQTELAFISDKDDAEAKQPKFKVYLWERGSGATVQESAQSATTPRQWRLRSKLFRLQLARLSQGFCRQRKSESQFFARWQPSVPRRCASA